MPATIPDRLHSATGCVNKPTKDFLRDKFSEWYSAQIVKGGEGYIVDMRLLVLQPINAQWIIPFFDHVKAHNAIITKGLCHVDITGILELQAVS